MGADLVECYADEPLLRANPDRFTMFPVKCASCLEVTGPRQARPAVAEEATARAQVPGHLGDV